jgi:hypothetical protein
MKKFSCFVLFTLIIVGSCSAQMGQFAVINLKATVDSEVLFSWQLISDRRNTFQTAYQIQIVSDPVDFGSPAKLVWNTGEIRSDHSILVKGDVWVLKPAQKYYWRVKVRDQKGRTTSWSEISSFTTGLIDEADWHNALWIGYEDISKEKRMVPGIHHNGDNLGDLCMDRPVVPYLRKEFKIDRKVSGATLFITGLGHYEAFINGNKVGKGFLTPGWTNYDKTVLYNIYDVTSMLQQGSNVIGAIVGNGFYNINRERYRKLVIAFGNPLLLAQLRIHYSDGSEEILVTDTDWETAPSPIIYTSIFGGEDYDARLEQPGWNQPGFDDSNWRSAVAVTPPSGKLRRDLDYPVEIMESYSAVNIIKLKDGNWLYDFGQNASGVTEIKIKGRKGQVVRLIPCEIIDSDSQPNQSASGSPHYYTYIIRGDSIETWHPRFTYYGFRYVKIEGAAPANDNTISEKAELIDLRMLHNYNSTPSAGSFECSNVLFNKINTLILRAIKSNLQSILTDCPHREKLGWLEQTYLMGSPVHYNFNIYQLYSRQVYNMMEAQLDDGLIPGISPEYVQFTGGFRDSPEWGSAVVIIPWLIYKWYGDASVMEKAWPTMLRYVEYLKSRSENHIISYGLGDWFDYGPGQPGVSQLTPVALTATAIYYYDLKLMLHMASVLNRSDEQKRLTKWADEVKSAFKTHFFDPATCNISTGSQTAMAMPWCIGLVDVQFKDRVIENLADSIRANDNQLTAGDIGYRFLVEALASGGKSQLLYEMNIREDVPGYGYQLRKGATSLTESWPALENVSNNHLMLGHLMDWFYYSLGGISQTDQSVAYKETLIRPDMVGDIIWVNASYQSPYGEIRSEWEKKNYTLKLDVVIPANTSALVYIPYNKGSVITESGKDINAIKEIKVIGDSDNKKIIMIGSGTYRFSVE